MTLPTDRPIDIEREPTSGPALDPAPAGAVIVTTLTDGMVYGVTALSMSLLTDPLLLSVVVSPADPAVAMVARSGRFAASLLTEGQRPVAGWFAPGRGPEPRRFARVASEQQVTGAPVIAYCLSWYDCEVIDIVASAGEVVLVGRVVAVGGGVGEPMLRPASGFTQPSGMAHAGVGPLYALAASAHEMRAARQGVLRLLTEAAIAAGHPSRWAGIDALADPSAELGAPLGDHVHEPVGSRRSWLSALDLVCDAAGNRALVAVALVLTGQHGWAGDAVSGAGEHLREDESQLRSLAEALRAGDADAAAGILARHLGGAPAT